MALPVTFQPLGLDAEGLDALMTLAAALRPKDRPPFLKALAAELQTHPGEIGAGAIHRVGRQLQRQFLRNVTGAADE